MRVSSALGEAGKNMLHQGGDVFTPLTQGRHAQGDDIDAKKKIVPEPALGNEPRKILMRSRQDAHIHRLLRMRAHRSHRAFLNGTQQFHLH